MSRQRDPQVMPAGGPALPPRLDPRAGRPPRPRTTRRGGEELRRPAAAGGARRGGRDAATTHDHHARGFGQTLGLTVLNTILPGTAFLAAGYKRTGALLLAAFVALVAMGAYLATAGQELAVRLAVSPTGLLLIIAAVVGLAIVWSLTVIAGYRVLAPDSTTGGQHVLGSVLVTLLALGVAAPAFEAAHLASVQRNLITGLFGDDVESATVPEAKADPWADKERVNILLLGGDGGDGRTGVRTDTVIVASIDTQTGATTTFSLPRNLEELPFPEDSPLHDVYPDGFDAGSESESLLNAVYRNGPAAHPDILGPTDNPGADFLKLGVGEALGLTLDYYVLVNLDGFSQLIDALGGITVNVNYFVPVGGDPGTGSLPDDYIAPGPNQHMDGTRALQYARGRFGLSDYQRMDRQRCMINAIVGAADPMTMLSRYQQIAATTQDIVSTDIPQAVVGDFADLALKVKDAGMQSVVFDDSVIRPAYPDFDLIRSTVQDALAATPSPTPTPAEPAPAGGATTGTGGAPAPAPTEPAPASESPVTNAADACAYDPVAASEALEEGEPPTRR
ncbi:LCP family protein [Blastococcus haudaquaticus]|uniref:Transcriptional attenuator, LytR family n=1 Tax=Blastococcus haudaquaticus TaxID=1938745 RepID=A0A286GE25_9ACTN|nr:LCP family protein [Blastococcus haudaquaticus]SOD93773.1 transcriptional attenuator, LytR family [Blastococcus haudaquaticus]